MNNDQLRKLQATKYDYEAGGSSMLQNLLLAKIATALLEIAMRIPEPRTINQGGQKND